MNVTFDIVNIGLTLISTPNGLLKLTLGFFFSFTYRIQHVVFPFAQIPTICATTNLFVYTLIHVNIYNNKIL